MTAEERGVVVGVEGGKVLVELEPTAACKGCGLCGNMDGGRMRLEVEAVEGVRPGQRVVVSVDRSMPLRSALFLFGLPAVGFIGGLVLGQYWAVTGLGADGSSAAFGLGLLLVAYVVARVYDRKVAARRSPPALVRIET